MKFSAVLLLSALISVLLGGTEVLAQRGGGGSFQQNQVGGLGATAQSPFGTGAQSPFGQPGQQLGTQAGGLRGQQGQAAGQRQVGGQDGFVGTDAQQIRDRQQNNPRERRRAMFNLAIESLNEIRDTRREERRNRNRQSPVRVQVRPLFTVPATAAPEFNARVQTNFQRALPSTAGATRVTVNGSTATIEGTTASDYDRQLAAKMLSLQPGITAVENRITVASGQ